MAAPGKEEDCPLEVGPTVAPAGRRCGAAPGLGGLGVAAERVKGVGEARVASGIAGIKLDCPPIGAKGALVAAQGREEEAAVAVGLGDARL